MCRCGAAWNLVWTQLKYSAWSAVSVCLTDSFFSCFFPRADLACWQLLSHEFADYFCELGSLTDKQPNWITQGQMVVVVVVTSSGLTTYLLKEDDDENDDFASLCECIL
jgi:hypothetical protein